MKGSPSLLLAAMLSLPFLAQAAEPAQCSTVNFSDVGWTDITVTTATTSVVLEALGYKTKTTMISVPVTYNCLLYTSPSPRDLSTSRMPSSA